MKNENNDTPHADQGQKACWTFTQGISPILTVTPEGRVTVNPEARREELVGALEHAGRYIHTLRSTPQATPPEALDLDIVETMAREIHYYLPQTGGNWHDADQVYQARCRQASEEIIRRLRASLASPAPSVEKEGDEPSPAEEGEPSKAGYQEYDEYGRALTFFSKRYHKIVEVDPEPRKDTPDPSPSLPPGSPSGVVEALRWADALEITAKDKADMEMIETNAATYRNLVRIIRALASPAPSGVGVGPDHHALIGEAKS